MSSVKLTKQGVRDLNNIGPRRKARVIVPKAFLCSHPPKTCKDTLQGTYCSACNEYISSYEEDSDV